MRVLIIFLKKVAKNGEAAGVRKKIKLRVESVKKKFFLTYTLIIVDTLWSVSLVVCHSVVKGAVHWKLKIITAQSVSVSVRVGVKSTLKKTRLPLNVI